LELSNPKGSTVEYANAVVPQQDAIHSCPALIVLKEENNNNNNNLELLSALEHNTVKFIYLFIEKQNVDGRSRRGVGLCSLAKKYRFKVVARKCCVVFLSFAKVWCNIKVVLFVQ